MPKFTFDLPSGAVARLQPIVARYNLDYGTDLSLQAWLLLHIKEIAVQHELAAAHQAHEQQAQQDLEAALRAERQRLLDAL